MRHLAIYGVNLRYLAICGVNLRHLAICGVNLRHLAIYGSKTISLDQASLAGRTGGDGGPSGVPGTLGPRHSTDLPGSGGIPYLSSGAW